MSKDATGILRETLYRNPPRVTTSSSTGPRAGFSRFGFGVGVGFGCAAFFSFFGLGLSARVRAVRESERKARGMLVPVCVERVFAPLRFDGGSGLSDSQPTNTKTAASRSATRERY